MFALQTVVPVEDVTAQLWFAPVLPWRWLLQSESEADSCDYSMVLPGAGGDHPSLLKWFK